MTTLKNNVEDLKIGQELIWDFYGNKTKIVITNITKTRVMFDTNSKYTTSTGRSSSIEWQGKKTFQKSLNSGEYSII